MGTGSILSDALFGCTRAALIKRGNMPTMRKFFGWLFGVVSVICFGVALYSLYRDLVEGGGISRQSSRYILATLIVFCVLLAMAFMYAMAWWTTWKSKPSERAWGIAASLAQLFVPFYAIYFHHRQLSNGKWQMIALGTLALIAYAWPDSRTEPNMSSESRVPNVRP